MDEAKQRSAARPMPSLTMWRLVACLALAAWGCGAGACGNRRPPPPSDPAQAKVALQAALDAWQQGMRPEMLKNRKPPMLVADEDWQDGQRLLGYQIGEGELIGLRLRCPVVLMLEGQPGQPVQKEANYAVATQPLISVRRDDR
jgi:hypothetical protein